MHDAPRGPFGYGARMADQRDGTELARLTLADWRRRVSDLYVDVRRMAADDPAIALGHWRAVRETLFREHPDSPVPADRRGAFRALHFERDPSLRFEVVVQPAPSPDPGHGTGLTGPGLAGAGLGGAGLAGLSLPNSGADTLAFARIGTVEIPFPAGTRRLSLFWMQGYTGGLFLPFRDATNGSRTYGAGRYLLDGAKSADLGAGAAPGSLVLDFNFAYQPSCAFDPKWACPLAPPENRLDIRVEAGERIA